jgi:hypothetical protein
METTMHAASTATEPTTKRSSRRRTAIITVVVCFLAVAWYLFRPELLFVNHNVNEGFPTAAMSTSGGVMPLAAKSQGTFHDGAHATKGTATIYEGSGGNRVLRLTNFETSNGPDVHVLLGKAADAKDSEAVKTAGYTDLGSIKGNIGDQNYEIPGDVNLADVKSVTIWCKRFSVNFGTAPLAMN